MIKIEFCSRKFCITSFLWLVVKKVIVFKTSKLLLNLFQIDGPVNKMLYWPKWLFFKVFSEAICDLVIYIFLERTKSSFTYNGEVPFQWLENFVAMRCSTLFFVGSQFIFLNSLAPICCHELSFKQIRIYLFWVTCNLFLIFWLIKGHQEIQA